MKGLLIQRFPLQGSWDPRFQVNRPCSSKSISSKKSLNSCTKFVKRKPIIKVKCPEKSSFECKESVYTNKSMNKKTESIAATDISDTINDKLGNDTEIKWQLNKSDSCDIQTLLGSFSEQALETENQNAIANAAESSKDGENLPIETVDDPSEQGSSVDNSEVNFCTQQNSITCNICDKSFASSFSLSYHIKQHNLNNQIHKCLVCSKILSSASSLDRHMLVHSGERPFKCKICDMAFTTNGNMHRHMRTHAEYVEIYDGAKVIDLRKKDFGKKKLPDSEIRPVSQESVPNKAIKGEHEKLLCPVCGKSFACRYSLDYHMETHPNDPIVCQSCHEVSNSYAMHVKHKCNVLDTETQSHKSISCGFQDLNFIDFSTDKFSLISKSSCEQNIKRPSSAFHVFECSVCKKAFPCNRALQLHMNVHNNNIGTFCSTCNCNFGTSAFLQLHQLKHRSAEHYILQNHSTNALGNENSLHAEKEDFLAIFNLQTKESQSSLLKEIKSCQVKEGKFENMDYFVHGAIKKEHLKESEETDNSSNNDFADIQSILSLTSRAPLINAVQTLPVAVQPMSPLNMTLPSQDSPLIADSANASPQMPSTDSAVQLLHTKNVPKLPVTINNIYSCITCSQKFRNINTLKRHSKLHVQRSCNYSCHLCPYTSVDKSTLIRHLRTHNGERPFQCTICKYAFTTKANCERHVKKRHKKLTKPEIRNFMQYNPNMSLKAPAVSSSDIGSSETVCKYCNSDFKFNRVLRHHLRSLHNSCNRKPFSCKICSFGFSTKNNCIRHVLKQHPNMRERLRSVVVLNASKDISEISGTESDNNGDIKAMPSAIFAAPTEQIEPLNFTNQTKSLNLPSSLIATEITSNETVIAAESLVSLSETFLCPDEPLDLAIQPLDLSIKPESAVNKLSKSTENFSLFPVRSQKSCKFINLPTSATFVLIPEITASIVHDNRTISCSTQTKSVFPNVINAKREKLRSFTCIYCSSGFTLKSNMERHIKRKHPEYARPTRSRNFISSVIAHRSQRQNINMLSDRTRDALRHVLNNKVQQNPVYTGHVLAPDIYVHAKSSDCDNHSIIGKEKIENSCTEETIDLSEKSLKFNASNMGNSTLSKATSFPEVIADENSVDLASVSSVICTANSQRFQQYFEKPTLDKNNTPKGEENFLDGDDTIKLKKENNVKVTRCASSSVCCPFCSCKFPWSSSLRRHILTHTGQKPYKCPRCILRFTTKSNCERHLIRKHGHKGDLISRSVPDRPFKCTQCASSTFSTQGNLRKHFYLKHWTKSCRGINSKTANKENEKNKALKKPTEEHSYSQVEEREKVLNCNFCCEAFDELSHLAKHMESHNSVKYICFLCRKLYSRSDTCFNHFKESHSLYLKMLQRSNEFCVTNLENKKNMGKETVDVEDNMLIACMICFQKTTTMEELQQHIKLHFLAIIENSDERTSTIKTENSCLSTMEAKKKAITNIADRKIRQKNKVKNSLLYLLNPTENNSLPSTQSPEVKEVSLQAEEEGSDLIQNLLGIHDSRIIDAMLVSADSAARLLGVNKI